MMDAVEMSIVAEYHRDTARLFDERLRLARAEGEVRMMKQAVATLEQRVRDLRADAKLRGYPWAQIDKEP